MIIKNENKEEEPEPIRVNVHEVTDNRTCTSRSPMREVIFIINKSSTKLF